MGRSEIRTNTMLFVECVYDLMEVYGILNVLLAIIKNKDKFRAVWDTEYNLEVANMSNSLQLIKSTNFGEVKCDIYQNENGEVFMTINQLAAALEYASKSGVENIMSRNKYLRGIEFSTTHEMRVVEGSRIVEREMTIFTEDGIYEVTMLSGQPKAKEFRAWIRKVLKALRKGEAVVIPMNEYQRMIIQSRLENAKIRKAQLYTKLANKYPGTYSQVLDSYATFELTGQHLLPLPEVGQKTYSATEIGKRLGISANMVGILTNRHELKNETYGMWCNDKAKGHNKEVTTFRYYEAVVPVLQGYLDKAPKALD